MMAHTFSSKARRNGNDESSFDDRILNTSEARALLEELACSSGFSGSKSTGVRASSRFVELAAGMLCTVTSLDLALAALVKADSKSLIET
jgi:hypothetical protein